MTDPYLPSPQRPGHADHGTPGLLDNTPFRSAVTGLAIDIGVATSLVVVSATTSDSVNWQLLGLSVVRTVLQTAASWVLKRWRPVTTPG